MIGVGVMLKAMSGNSESVNVLTEAIGKRITALKLGDDDALHFEFADGSRMKLSDEGQSCCEARYMQTDDDLESFVGAVLLGAEIKDGPEVEDEHSDVHEVQFLEVNTDRGSFTMASHNEHNGYYGGFCVMASVE